ncbi:SDR family oxidoreductase [Sphingomonas sp. AAP5]|uniref:SDR family NAD(P)-dependent oxidoreductase n=1 Tax=Sphingomonas sp. AAP5 TaxID=1523415 RepID=UPI001056F00B|nr:SDR family NAD(P)-dependent oxidoreductase [Sphingomonas sp. AAP5]QBM75067.1 SDR family oxidoreductase [Sphingomonas sp. AAP5]
MSDAIVLPANGSFSFAGRTALVTGAGNGCGEAIAREIHAGGGKVAVSDVNLEAAMRVVESLDPLGETAVAVVLDVRKKGDFLAARDRLAGLWGNIDIVVNNAGYAKRTPTQDITPDEFDEIVAINMRSVFLSCQIFSEHMKSNGYGRIVNITSLAGQNGGTVASPHYAASKAGAIMLTKYFARYVADSGVTVNAISPGPIDTAKARLSPEQIARVEGEVPIGRFMQLQEIAAAAALLASDRGGFFVGATLDMNGGLYLR